MDESSPSAQRKDREQGAMSKSLMVTAPCQTKEKDPPPYGAQYRQDALWEGGNEALPPQWWQFKLLDDTMGYQDETFVMVSQKRPLPGVRLDYPGQLVPGCQWHISPLGQSYFVNHNTKTTSWKKPLPERPSGSLTPECIIEGHSQIIKNLAYLGTSCNILSASHDGSMRQWTRDGEPVGRPWNTDGRVCAMAISPDESMVVSGGIDGRLRLWNIREGSMVGEPWEGQGGPAVCIDWSSNAQEIASGSEDGTIRRWSPNTGQQIAPPIDTGHGMVCAVRYSPQGGKFTSGGEDKVIRVWSKDGELLLQVEGHDGGVMSLRWSKDGAHIFSVSADHTIRKWRSIDGKELVVFQGHTNIIISFCLSLDEDHLVSAAADYSVRIWDLKTNQPVGDPLLHDDEVWVVVISPDGKYIASAGSDGKICLWSLNAALKHVVDDHLVTEATPDAKFKGRVVRSTDATGQVFKKQSQAVNRGLTLYGKDFWDADTNPTPPSASPPSSLHWRNLLGLLPFSTGPANAPQSIPLEPRRRNFNLFPGGSSVRTVEVAAGRKKNRIYVSPPSAAELARAEAAAAAAAAAQCMNDNEVVSSTQVGQSQAVSGTQVSQGRPVQTQPGPSLVVPGTQVSQGQPVGTQGTGGGTGVSYEVRCCGLFFSCGDPSVHQP